MVKLLELREYERLFVIVAGQSRCSYDYIRQRLYAIARGDMPARLQSIGSLAQWSRCGVRQLHLRAFDKLGG